MYLIIKNTRLFREVSEDSPKIDSLLAFGREWEPPTHSDGDEELISVWNREYRYSKIKNKPIVDGLYKLKSGGKLLLLVPAATWR